MEMRNSATRSGTLQVDSGAVTPAFSVGRARKAGDLIGRGRGPDWRLEALDWGRLEVRSGGGLARARCVVGVISAFRTLGLQPLLAIVAIRWPPNFLGKLVGKPLYGLLDASTPKALTAEVARSHSGCRR